MTDAGSRKRRGSELRKVERGSDRKYVFVFGNTVRESDRERKTTEKEGGRGNDEQDKICAEKKNPTNGIFPSNEKYDEGDGWTMTWLHIGR